MYIEKRFFITTYGYTRPWWAFAFLVVPILVILALLVLRYRRNNRVVGANANQQYYLYPPTQQVYGGQYNPRVPLNQAQPSQTQQNVGYGDAPPLYPGVGNTGNYGPSNNETYQAPAGPPPAHVK